MPFVSREQQQACYAKDDPAWDCHEWSQATKGKKLPSRKSKGGGVKPSPVANRNVARTRPINILASPRWKLVGKWLQTHGLMPGYGQIYYNPTSREAWYVGGDGDEPDFHKLVVQKLKTIHRVQRVRYESEQRPNGSGWVKVFDPQHPTSNAFALNSSSIIYNSFCPTGVGGGIDPTCSPHSDTTSSQGKASSGIVGLVKSAIGAGIAAEHYVKDRIVAGVSALPTPIQAVVKAVYSAAMASYTAGQALAERVAIERGASKDDAHKLRTTLATVDVVLAKPAALAGELTGVGASIGFIPLASVGYLAYSTVRNPLATMRAAHGLVSEALGHAEDWLGKLTSGGKAHAPSRSTKPTLKLNTLTTNIGLTEAQADSIANALHNAGYSDWYIALLSASLDRVHDLTDSINLANTLFKEAPTTNVEQETLDLLTINGRWVTLFTGRHMYINDDGSVSPKGPPKGHPDYVPKGQTPVIKDAATQGTPQPTPSNPSQLATLASTTTTKPTPSTHIEQAHQHLASAIHELKTGVARERSITVPEVTDKLKAKIPGLTTEHVHQTLHEASQQDRLTLQLVNDVRLEPRAKEMIHTDTGVLGYVQWRGPTHNTEHEWILNSFCATGQGGGVDPTCSPSTTSPATATWQSAAIDGLHKSIDRATHLTPEHQTSYKQSMNRVISSMPLGALKRLATGLSGVSWHTSTDTITAEFKKLGGQAKEGTVINGYYNPNSKKATLNGSTKMSNSPGIEGNANVHGVHAHELTHAIDRGSGKDPALSTHSDWLEAHHSEIVGDPTQRPSLSKYARTSAAEGFAEFGRLVYGSDRDKKEAETKFPKCFAFWRQHGLWE